MHGQNPSQNDATTLGTHFMAIGLIVHRFPMCVEILDHFQPRDNSLENAGWRILLTDLQDTLQPRLTTDHTDE